MDGPVKVDVSERIAMVTLNRPKVLNAFNEEMLRELANSLVDLTCDPNILGLVITGEGKGFCAGADLKSITTMGKTYGEAFHLLAGLFHQAALEIRRMPKPVVAALNGVAAGGGFSMAFACDFRIMEASAQLRQAYTSNGLSIDGGGTFTLPRLVGLARALEIAAFDRPIPAEQAQSWGLVTEVVEDGQSIARAVEMVQEITNGAVSSFGRAKELMNDSFNTSLETQLEKERVALSWCGDHPNGQEGIAAFLEKRKPVYKN